MLCENCESQLVLGKGQDVSEKWCPTCEGFETLSKKESIDFFNKSIEKSGQEIKRLINIYESNSLLTTLFATREGNLIPVLHGYGFDGFSYLSINELICKILKKGSNGTKKCDVYDEEYQSLLHIAQMQAIDLRMRLVTINDLGCFIRIPAKLRKDLALDFELSARVMRIQPTTGGEELVELFKFYDDWQPIMDNLQENGFFTGNDMYINQMKNSTIKESFEYYFKLVQTKLSFELTMSNKDLLNQDKFKQNLDIIYLIEFLSEKFMSCFHYSQNTPLDFYCTVTPVAAKKFKKEVKKYGYDLSKAYELLVSKQDQKTNFPLIYEDGNKLLIPPITLRIFKDLLKSIYFKDIKDEISKEGYRFEKKVCDALQIIGLKIHQPNDTSKIMMNIKDDDLNPSLEIDIVAYDYGSNKLFIIDCKNVLINIDFVLGGREKAIRDKFSEQPEKQKKRIDYIKTNLLEYGLDENKINKYISVLLTANKEPIDKIDNCHILPLREIERIRDLEPI